MTMHRALTRAETRQFEERAIRELGIPSLLLMENAGRGAAEIVVELARRRGARRVVVFSGPGNNGGDGFVIARHVFIAAVTAAAAASHAATPSPIVLVRLCGERAKLTPDAAVNLAILERMGVSIRDVSTPEEARAAAGELEGGDVVVDALLGTGFSGAVREPTASLIQGLNAAARTAVIAVDVPSGLDCDTGTPSNATIRADLTITFVATKVGFLAPGARDYTGNVEVRGIGAPRAARHRRVTEEE